MAAKTPSKRQNRRGLRLESLEDRKMMAGNVGAYVSYGTLYVNGDNASNGLNITQVAPGTFDVAGSYTGGAATRVNGSYAPVRFYGVTDDVRVNTKDGNDRVVIGGTSESTRDILPDDLFVDTGNGADFVRVQWLSNRDYNDRININTGWGNDRVEMYKVVCRDYMNINTAQNWDTVDLNYITVGKKLSYYGGAGNDNFNLNRAIVDQVYADMGSENDRASVRNTTVKTHGVVHGGYGIDTFNLYNNNRWLSHSGMERFTRVNS